MEGSIRKSGTPKGAPQRGSKEGAGTSPAPLDAKAAQRTEAAKKHAAGKEEVIAGTKKKKKDLLSNVRKSLGYAHTSGLGRTLKTFIERLQLVSASFKGLGNYDFGELVYGYNGPLKKSMKQLETQLKKHVKKVPEAELAKLASKQEELDKVVANETAGAYLFRALGFMPPATPKGIDKNTFLLQAILVKLKISDSQKKHSLIGRKEIFKGINPPEKGYKGPTLHKNDVILFMVKIKGVRTLVGGLYQDEPTTNNIRIKTRENGKLVYKTYHMRDAFFAFAAPGNTEAVAKKTPKKPKAKQKQS
ncbi:hypothetical protein ACFL3C_03740 [Patescibacteria group bacterium]